MSAPTEDDLVDLIETHCMPWWSLVDRLSSAFDENGLLPSFPDAEICAMELEAYEEIDRTIEAVRRLGVEPLEPCGKSDGRVLRDYVVAYFERALLYAQMCTGEAPYTCVDEEIAEIGVMRELGYALTLMIEALDPDRRFPAGLSGLRPRPR